MKKILSFPIVYCLKSVAFSLFIAFIINPINSLLPSAFGLFSVPAYAEEKTASLEEIVVTATKVEEPKKLLTSRDRTSQLRISKSQHL